jgi:hypothetical protein
MLSHNAGEYERKYLASRTAHIFVLHGRICATLIGAIFFFGGMLLLTYYLKWSICDVFLLLDVVSILSTCAWIAIPCRCGKVPVLSQKGRLALATPRRIANLERCLIRIVAAVVFFLLTITLVLTLFDGRAALAYQGACFAVLGCVTIIASVFNKLPNRLELISEKEQQEVYALKGETEEQLDKLTDYYLKTGNFSAAFML